jgi:hypothetical protein
VARVEAAFQALGGRPGGIEVILSQFTHLVEGSERAAMSKRRGEFVTLDELLDEIGVDATRYFMLQRSHDRTLDLDLDLAKRESAENPVYYIQYAHARIVTMLGRLSAERIDAALAAGVDWGTAELDPSERSLIQALAAFPDEVAEAAERRAPHRIAAYALDLAQEFTAFYRDCKVIGAEPDHAGSGAVGRRRARLDVARLRVAGEVGVEPARLLGIERRQCLRVLAGCLPGPPSPPGQREGERHEPGNQQRRRQDVDEQVEAVRGWLGKDRRPVLLHHLLLDLPPVQALADQLADVRPLRERLRRLGDRQRLVAVDAHQVALDLSEGGARLDGRRRGGAGERCEHRECCQQRDRRWERAPDRGRRLQVRSARIRGSARSSHCWVTGPRCSA